jgi:hypothetical protein
VLGGGAVPGPAIDERVTLRVDGGMRFDASAATAGT